MTKDEAMQMALDVITEPHPGIRTNLSDAMIYREKIKAAIEALRAALAQPKPEPVAKNEEGRITWLVDNWPQNCLLFAEPPKWTPVEIGVDVTSEGTHVVGMYVLMPEAVRHVFYSQFHPAPPQREWQGLTDEEIDKTYETQIWDARRSYARAIEAKLKEKNT